MRRQDLDGDFLYHVVIAADQERVNRELDIIGRIGDVVAAKFVIEHCGSVARVKDLVRLAGQQRPNASTQPEPFLLDRGKRLTVGPFLNKDLALTLDSLPV